MGILSIYNKVFKQRFQARNESPECPAPEDIHLNHLCAGTVSGEGPSLRRERLCRGTANRNSAPSAKAFPLQRGSLFKEVLRISKILGPEDIGLFFWVEDRFLP